MLYHGLVSSENAILSHFVTRSFNQNNTKSFSCREATKIKHESESRDRYLRNAMFYYLTSSKAGILRHQWTIYLIYSSSNIVQSLACLGVYILTSELKTSQILPSMLKAIFHWLKRITICANLLGYEGTNLPHSHTKVQSNPKRRTWITPFSKLEVFFLAHPVF